MNLTDEMINEAYDGMVSVLFDDDNNEDADKITIEAHITNNLQSGSTKSDNERVIKNKGKYTNNAKGDIIVKYAEVTLVNDVWHKGVPINSQEKEFKVPLGYFESTGYIYYGQTIK